MTDATGLSAFLSKLAATPTAGTVIYDSPSRPGVVDVAHVGVAAYALACELSATTSDVSRAADVLARHKEHNPDTFELVLHGALIDLACRKLETAYRVLDGSSTDLRARAAKDWNAIREATRD